MGLTKVRYVSGKLRWHPKNYSVKLKKRNLNQEIKVHVVKTRYVSEKTEEGI